MKLLKIGKDIIINPDHMICIRCEGQEGLNTMSLYMSDGNRHIMTYDSKEIYDRRLQETIKELSSV